MSSSAAVFRNVGIQSKLAKAARWTWSRYVVQRVEMRAHRPDVAWEPPANTGADATFTRHYFYVDSEGEFQPCKPEAVVASLWRATSPDISPVEVGG